MVPRLRGCRTIPSIKVRKIGATLLVRLGSALSVSSSRSTFRRNSLASSGVGGGSSKIGPWCTATVFSSSAFSPSRESSAFSPSRESRHLICTASFAEYELRLTRCLIVNSPESFFGKTDDDFATLHLNDKSRQSFAVVV